MGEQTNQNAVHYALGIRYPAMCGMLMRARHTYTAHEDCVTCRACLDAIDQEGTDG